MEGENVPPDKIKVTRFAQITDGLSHTLMFSETVQGHSGEKLDLRGFTWWGWGSGFESSLTPNTTSPTACRTSTIATQPTQQSTMHRAQFSFQRDARGGAEPTSGGVNLVTCDGAGKLWRTTWMRIVLAAGSTQEGEAASDSL